MTRSGITPPLKTPNLAKSPPGTYAEAARRDAEKRRKFRKEDCMQELSPYALHVHIGKTERNPMNKATYDSFREVLKAKTLENAVAERSIPLHVQFTSWNSRKHAGVIVCMDETTSLWYRETIDTIELDGTTFRAWPIPKPVVGKATFNAKGLNITPEQAVTLVNAYNKELRGGASLSRAEVIIAPHSGDPIIEIALSDDAAAILGVRDPKWTLKLGTDRRRVKYYGREELAKRLHEGGHELAERFRATSLDNDGGDEMDLVETEDERQALAASG